MPNPLKKFLNKETATALAGRAAIFTVFLSGIARDFWKDGTENPLKGVANLHVRKRTNQNPVVAPAAATSATSPAGRSVKVASGPPEWHAAPGEISEKMWGEGFVTPGGETVADMLIKPLGLNKEMSILDLSAGVGGLMRKVAAESGAAFTGLEPDAGVAVRGMEMALKQGKDKKDAIVHYMPAEFLPGKTVTRLYDAIVACETFYRVKDKQAFFTALAACGKPQAQISFTDYIVNPEDRTKPAIVRWMQHEAGAAPFSLIEMAEAWAKAGFKLRINDDETEYYRKEVLAGLTRFTLSLKNGPRPDAETKQAILRRIENWMHRLAAMEEGMKFYRFYGTK